MSVKSYYKLVTDCPRCIVIGETGLTFKCKDGEVEVILCHRDALTNTVRRLVRAGTPCYILNDDFIKQYGVVGVLRRGVKP